MAWDGLGGAHPALNMHGLACLILPRPRAGAVDKAVALEACAPSQWLPRSSMDRWRRHWLIDIQLSGTALLCFALGSLLALRYVTVTATALPIITLNFIIIILL